MRLVLKGTDILARSGQSNPHQLALRARVSSPTVAKYITRPHTVQVVDLAVLAALLTDGLGMDWDKAGELRLKDVFQLVDQ